MRPYAARKTVLHSPEFLANIYRPGNPGGPGRPRGSRSKLNELAVAIMHKDFLEHGEETVKRVRETQPATYLQAILQLLPKMQQKIESPFADLTDDELDQLEQLLAAIRATTVSDLEPRPRARQLKGRTVGTTLNGEAVAHTESQKAPKGTTASGNDFEGGED